MEFNKPAVLDVNGDIASNFATFKEEVQIYLVATETVKKSHEIQVARLKNLLGSEGLKLYKSLTDNDNHETITSILDVLEKHCVPRQNITVNIYKLFSRKQLPEEPFEQFYADLKRLIRPCKFEDQEEKILTALIALGVRSTETQQRLLRDDNKLEDVVKFCKSVELSERNMQVLQNNKPAIDVAQVQHSDVNVVNNSSSNFSSARKVTQHGFSKYNSQQPEKIQCNRCGREHIGFNSCPAIGKICNFCSKPNHFSYVCRKRRAKQSNEVTCQDNANSDEIGTEINSIFIVDSVNKKPFWCKEVLINGCKLKLKLDSGADVNILPYHILKQCNIPYNTLRKCNIHLQAYGGFKIIPVGSVTVEVETGSKISLVDFIVVQNQTATPILGLQACLDLNLIKRLDSIGKSRSEETSKNLIFKQYKSTFEGLGCFPDVCSLKLKPDAKPSICAARRIPIKIKEKFHEKLKLLESEGIITKVEEPVDWVNSVVIVEKPNGSLRICLDPIHLNKYIVKEPYTIPTIKDLAPNLSHKKIFTVLDIKDAFYHISLDESSSKMCSFSTPFGTYRFLRAPFGLSCLPELFQRLVSKYFGDIKGVSLYFDDLCISSNSKEENDEILKQVLERAKEFNIKFNFNKFQYCIPEVKYVGVIFNEQGMLPDPEKVQAVKNLKNPNNKQELQRALGMINYLRDFIPNMSQLVSPLRELLKKQVEWTWTDTHSESFRKLKTEICSPRVLASFDPASPVEIQCDASKDTLGFCLLQKGRPVHFGSRSMTATEESYAQVEKELLAICFATNKLHNYIYGHNCVTVYTDHMPLVSIMSKPIDKVLNNRLKRLRLKLINYQFKIKYLPGKFMFIADLMSRTGIKTEAVEDETMKDYIHCLSTNDVKISEPKLKEFQEKSLNDDCIKAVNLYLHEGWPDIRTLYGEVKHMYKLKNELQTNNGLLYYGTRLVVPQTLRRLVLNILHETHLGGSKINSIVDQFYYWPGIYSDIKNLVSSCAVCQKYRRSNMTEPLLSHEIPSSLPFNKIAADIAECHGKHYLVIIDFYSRWLEVYEIPNKTSFTIVKKLKDVFSRFGIPETLIADNMPFNSLELRQFAKEWNFEIKTTSPYHSQSNGLVEKAVGITKQMLKKSKESKQDLELYLMNYRNAPVAGLPFSPTQLLNSRHIRTKLPMDKCELKPKLIPEEAHMQMKNNQYTQKLYYDRTSRKQEVQYFEGEEILVQNVFTKLWERGQVVEKLPQPRSYLIQLRNGAKHRRTSIHLKKLK